MTDAPDNQPNQSQPNQSQPNQGQRPSKLSAEAMARHIAHEHGRSPLADNLKEIVYGGLDGIITTFAVVCGFSGAALLGQAGNAEVYAISLVLLFGLANLLADGVSMGLGDFLSTRSEQARWNRERAVEVHEIEHNPDQEYEETVHLLEDQGMSAEDARQVAEIYKKYPGLWADWMMEHELQMEDMSEATPARDGLVTFLSFLVFGIIPLLPYLAFWGRDIDANRLFTLASVATVLALLALGFARSVVTRESPLRAMGEVFGVGLIAALIAFGVGTVLG